MTTSLFVLGLVLGALALPVFVLLGRALTIVVEDEEAILVTSFGKLATTLARPGLSLLPARLMPWTKVHRVSLRRDYREQKAIHVNDAHGTTVILDLWLELRIVDPAKALFAVTDWDGALRHLVAHAANSILGSREFRSILGDRSEIGELLQKEVAVETSAWGIAIELVFVRNISLLPEVSRQMFETTAARLERAKAEIEEGGRLDATQLEADTSMRVAALVAEAKGQYPAAVGRALHGLKARPAVFAAYNELYELSLVRPHRTVSFRGFASGELRATDAAMVQIDGKPPELAARTETLLSRP